VFSRVGHDIGRLTGLSGRRFRYWTAHSAAVPEDLRMDRGRQLFRLKEGFAEPVRIVRLARAVRHGGGGAFVSPARVSGEGS